MVPAARCSELPGTRRLLVEAALVVTVSAIAALTFNWLRPNSLPLAAPEPYEVLVPCPEPGGEVTGISPHNEMVGSSRSYLIDARSPQEHGSWHPQDSINVPYDWLDPLPESELSRLAREIASSRSSQVVVFGDGGRPDSGEHLGREISGRGIHKVFFVKGGAPALMGLEQ